MKVATPKIRKILERDKNSERNCELESNFVNNLMKHLEEKLL